MQPHRVLGVSTMLGIAGVIASFGMFYIAERVLHLDREVVQTLMYLKLSVAGHLNIFVTRTRGPFWSIMPARILLIAVFGTQALATIIAVSGLLMPAISWELAGLVWGYALVWFLINDQVKLLGYRIQRRAGHRPARPCQGRDRRAESLSHGPYLLYASRVSCS